MASISTQTSSAQVSSSPTSAQQMARQTATASEREIRSRVRSEDPRFRALQEAQQNFREDSLGSVENLRSGAVRNLETTREELREASRFSLRGGFSRMSGLRGALLRQEHAERNFVGSLNDQRREFTQNLATSNTAANQFVNYETQGQVFNQRAETLTRAGRMEDAQKMRERAQNSFNSAQLAYTRAMGQLDVDTKIDTAAYTRELQEISGELADSVQILDATETTLRTVRTGAIVVGATVATGGLATGTLAVGAGIGTVTAGMSTAGVVATGIAGGTAVGTIAGGASNLAEAGGHVARGNKTGRRALRDAGRATVQDLRTSATASVGTLVGLGATHRLAQGGATVLRQAVGAGAAQGATSSVVNNSIDVAKGDRQIGASIGRDIIQDTIVGGVSAGAGSRIGAVRDAARTTSGQITAAGAELGADVSIGVASAEARALAEGRHMTYEEMNQEITGAVAGSAMGNVVNIRTQGGRGGERETEASPQSPSPDSAEAQQGGDFATHDDFLEEINRHPAPPGGSDRLRELREERASGDEAALVGAGVEAGPPELSAAVDGPSYNAESNRSSDGPRMSADDDGATQSGDSPSGDGAGGGYNDTEASQVLLRDEPNVAAQPNKASRNPMSEDDMFQAIDTLEDDKATPLSVQERVDLVENLQKEDLLDTVWSDLGGEQRAKLDAAMTVSRLVASSKLKSGVASRFADRLVTVSQNTDVTIADIEGILTGSGENAAYHVSAVMGLAEQGIAFSKEDFKTNESSRRKVRRARELQEEGLSPENISKRLENEEKVNRAVSNMDLSDGQKERLSQAIHTLHENHNIELDDLLKMSQWKAKVKVNGAGTELNGRDFVADLGELAKPDATGHVPSGLDKLFGTMNEILKGNNSGEASGYFAEARTAVNLKSKGNRIIELSRDFIDHRGVDREIDIVMERPNGSFVFVEVKETTEAFLSKNESRAISNSQVIAEGRYAESEGAEYVVAIEDTADINKTKANQVVSQKVRIQTTVDKAMETGELIDKPLIISRSGSSVL